MSRRKGVLICGELYDRVGEPVSVEIISETKSYYHLYLNWLSPTLWELKDHVELVQ